MRYKDQCLIILPLVCLVKKFIQIAILMEKYIMEIKHLSILIFAPTSSTKSSSPPSPAWPWAVFVKFASLFSFFKSSRKYNEFLFANDIYLWLPFLYVFSENTQIKYGSWLANGSSTHTVVCVHSSMVMRRDSSGIFMRTIASTFTPASYSTVPDVGEVYFNNTTPPLHPT